MLASLPAQVVHVRQGTATIQTIEPSSRFIDLPDELWTATFLQVDVRTIVRCCACKYQASVELQYRIELVADGMVDGPPSSLTVKERLARLRELRQSWATLQWSSKISVPIPAPCDTFFLVGGVLFNFCYSAPNLSNERERDLMGTWLPSALDPQAHTHDRKYAEVSTHEFAVDPSQDLIIYLTGGHTDPVGEPLQIARNSLRDSGQADTSRMRAHRQMSVASSLLEMHVRTLSTNEDHPEARSPTLRIFVPRGGRHSAIQIADDIICIWFQFALNQPLHITLWNWKTGKFITKHSAICAPYIFRQCTVISSRAFIITTIQKGGTIEIFTFDGDPAESEQPVGHPLLLTLSSSAHASKFVTQPKSNVTHVASLQLPATHPHVWVSNLSSCGGSIVVRPPTGRPFVTANEEKTYFFSVTYLNTERDITETPILRSRMFLKHSTLERYMRKYKSRSGAGEEGSTTQLVVPWEEWGRENTRFMVHDRIEKKGFQCVNGHRVLLASGRQSERSMVHVLDFNVRHAVWQSQCNPPDKVNTVDTPKAPPILLQPPRATPKHPRLITEPSVENHPSFFPEPVETTLPYCEVGYEPDEDYFGIMIGEERIFGTKEIVTCLWKAGQSRFGRSENGKFFGVQSCGGSSRGNAVHW
ncbi:hypothetical protein EDD15DRAFT_2193772 [Pisolithus albus]|nr:hypothetical protein EDD15DRAFT_2193772 [Pisolithus albus]